MMAWQVETTGFWQLVVKWSRIRRLSEQKTNKCKWLHGDKSITFKQFKAKVSSVVKWFVQCIQTVSFKAKKVKLIFHQSSYTDLIL